MTGTRAAASAVDRALRFVRDERGGAGALAAAMITMMAMGGAALIVDHVQLVGARDLVKTAADATAMAARLELGKLPNSMSDAEVLAHFERTSTKYAQLNILGNLRLPDLVPEDIAVAYSLDRDAGTVDATIEADLDLSLMTGRLYGHAGPERMRSLSGVVGEAPATVVLAIDTSNSMRFDLGDNRGGTTESRLQIVQRAAHDLVRILDPNPHDPVEIGLVPWSTTACIERVDCWPAHRQLATAPKTSAQEIGQAIDDLRTTGATRSSAGISVAKTLLGRAPRDNRKALVLLTDGEDNQCGTEPNKSPGNCAPSLAAQQRQEACTAAKDDGIEIFVIAAMVPHLVSGALEQGLRDCSSEGEREGRHVFVNNATPESLEAAFSNIANQLGGFRRVY